MNLEKMAKLFVPLTLLAVTAYTAFSLYGGHDKASDRYLDRVREEGM